MAVISGRTSLINNGALDSGVAGGQFWCHGQHKLLVVVLQLVSQVILIVPMTVIYLRL